MGSLVCRALQSRLWLADWLPENPPPRGAQTPDLITTLITRATHWQRDERSQLDQTSDHLSETDASQRGRIRHRTGTK